MLSRLFASSSLAIRSSLRTPRAFFADPKEKKKPKEKKEEKPKAEEKKKEAADKAEPKKK